MPLLAYAELKLLGRIVLAAVSLVFAIATAPSALLAAQLTQPPSDHKEVNAETRARDDRSTGEKPEEAPHKARAGAITNVELQRMENKLRRELLNDRATTLDWWLASTAIFLTLLGVVAAIAGYLSFRRFREIEIEARENAESSRQHAEEAQILIEEIKANRDRAASLVKQLNAETVAGDPGVASKLVESVQADAKASLMEWAVAGAVQLQRRGNIDAAIEKWRSIASVAEEADKELAARAWYSIGYLHGDKSDTEAAIGAYDEAIRLKPNLAGAYNNRGFEKNNLGQHDAAIADHDTAIELQPNLAEAYTNRGIAKKDLGLHQAAIADHDKAIHLRPDYSNAYNNRGVVRGILGQYERAIDDFDEAIRLKPDYAGAYTNRGFAKANMGQYQAAITDYDEAIKREPNSAQTFSHRAAASLHLGQKREAKRDYLKALSLAQSAGDKDLANSVEHCLNTLEDK